MDNENDDDDVDYNDMIFHIYGSMHRKYIFQYISNTMQLHTVYIYLVTAQLQDIYKLCKFASCWIYIYIYILEDIIFLFLLVWNTTMVTDRTDKSVENYRNNNDKMPISLTTAPKGKQGNCKHFQCIS
jgi:hypothetical protein